MRYIYLLLLLSGISAHAQTLFDEKYKDCGTGKPCYYCGDTAVGYRNFAARLEYALRHGMQMWVSTIGYMYFEIEVDSTGHSCVRSIRDDTHTFDVKNTFRTCINGLYDWRPAVVNNRFINSTIILQLRFVGDRASICWVKPEDIEQGSE